MAPADLNNRDNEVPQKRKHKSVRWIVALCCYNKGGASKGKVMALQLTQDCLNQSWNIDLINSFTRMRHM